SLRHLSIYHTYRMKRRSQYRQAKIRPDQRPHQRKYEIETRYRYSRSRLARAREAIQESRERKNKDRIFRRSKTATSRRNQCRFWIMEESARDPLPAHEQDFGRAWNGSERANNGVRKHGQHVRYRCRFHA